MNQAAPDAWVELSPADAQPLGISEGDWVRVESPRGAIEVRARIGRVMEGAVFAPFHYGHWDPDELAPETDHRLANELTMTVWDPVSKQPYFKTAACRVTKVRDGDGPSPAPTTTASAPALPADDGESQPAHETPPPPPGPPSTSHVLEHVPHLRPRPEPEEVLMPHLSTYVGLADHSEKTLADSFRAVAEGHAREVDVFHTCHLLAQMSDHHREALAPVVHRYGEDDLDRTRATARLRGGPGPRRRHRAPARPPGPPSPRHPRPDDVDRHRPRRPRTPRLRAPRRRDLLTGRDLTAAVLAEHSDEGSCPPSPDRRAMNRPTHLPVPLRQYALLADGERGALIGPHGNIAFLCAPRWHDDAVFSSLLGGAGRYVISPQDPRYVWGGHYDTDTLIWRSRWVAKDAVTECREALAFPGDPERVVLLRRVEATLGDAHVEVELDCRAEFGARAMIVSRSADGTWSGHTGDLHFRWSGAPTHARLVDGTLRVTLDVPTGKHHDLVLEISRHRLTGPLPDPDHAWDHTERAWAAARPDLSDSAAPGDSRHSHAVLRGLTGSTGAMVAAATTALPERAQTRAQLRLPLRLDP